MKNDYNTSKDSLELSQTEKVELLSEDVQEVMGHIPHWLVRWGITVVFCILIMVVAGSFAFKYPDVIKSIVVITSQNPSVSIFSRTSGKIDILFVQNEAPVQQGKVLAVLENSADFMHVTDLKQRLEVFSTFFNSPLIPITNLLRDDYSLGQIQSAFSVFQRQQRNYVDYLKTNMIGKKIHSIRQQFKDYINYEEKLKIQATNQQKALLLIQNQLKRDSSLLAGGVIAIADYERSEQNYLQAKNSYQSLLVVLANTQMQMNQLNYQIIDLESQQSEQLQTSLNALKESYDNLKAAIAEWEKQFVLISPIDGKITFNQYWNNNQYVQNGEVVFTVVPTDPQKMIGRLRIPLSGSGKVENGQKVLISLDNYPYTEFGMLEGKIETISLVPQIKAESAFYTAEISLPTGLITNYGNQLPFSQELQGTAEIITQELSLFDRLFNPVKAVYKRSKI